MERDYDCDVCIVGTGAGGGILAHQLAKAGVNVWSLEQGSRLQDDFFKTVMPPGAGSTFGIGRNTVWPSDPHDSLFVHPLFANGRDGSTARPEGGFQHFQVLAVNGLQNLWNGVSVRFALDDFKYWPIEGQSLDSHYSAVEKLITVCGTHEGIDALPDGEFIEPKPLRPADHMIVDAVQKLNDGYSYAIPNRKAINTRQGMATSCVSTGICTSGCPVGSVYKFTARLLPEIETLANYRLVSNAKVMRVVRSARHSQQIDEVEYLDTETLEKHSVRARVVVLATGAVETPRILFNSADATEPQGLGNAGGMLGRGLQDNPKVVLSTSLRRLWGKQRDYDIGYGDLLILMSRGKLAGGVEFPFIGHAIHGIPDVPHYLGQMKWMPPRMKERMAKYLFYSYVTLGLFCAGERKLDNKVRLADTTDRYGVRQVAVDFTMPESVHEQMDVMMAWGRKILKSASSTLIYETRDNSGTGIHYAGTTAMSADASEGVVDNHLRVHGFDNLYVCDGGVIPHLPDKHLTLTIMALSHRLAQRLSAQFQTHDVHTGQAA